VGAAVDGSYTPHRLAWSPTEAQGGGCGTVVLLEGALGVAPDGKNPAVGLDDSRLKVHRLLHKTYYAHFRIKVKPGSLLTYKGFMALRVPIQVAGGELTGWNCSGQCAAR
jgi:hypothetical protein